MGDEMPPTRRAEIPSAPYQVLAITASPSTGIGVEYVELDMCSVSDAAENVISGDIRLDDLRLFTAINVRTGTGMNVTEAVAEAVAEAICLRWHDDPEFDANLRAVIAWVEQELSASWDHGKGEFVDDRRLIAALNASRGVHHLVAAE